MQEKGKTPKALSELNTKEEHQFSTHVYKADGPTFYTRSKIQCLLRGRKYHNSILKQSIILLNVYRATLAHGMCWMFYTELGHPTLSRDVVQQGRKLGCWKQKRVSCQAFSSKGKYPTASLGFHLDI